MTTSANLTPPSEQKKVYVAWEGSKGHITRTMYRWREDAAGRLAKLLLAAGASKAWLTPMSVIPEWNERDKGGFPAFPLNWGLAVTTLNRL